MGIKGVRYVPILHIAKTNDTITMTDDNNNRRNLN